jgi:hypothetical protein
MSSAVALRHSGPFLPCTPNHRAAPSVSKGPSDPSFTGPRALGVASLRSHACGEEVQMNALGWGWAVVQAVVVAAASWLVFMLALEFRTKLTPRRSLGRSEPKTHEEPKQQAERAA